MPYQPSDGPARDGAGDGVGSGGHAAARFRADVAGVSAVEFALVLPVMLTLWAGMTEISHAINAWRKVTVLARTVADLTSQGDIADPMGSAPMSDILGSSAMVLRPFAATNAQIVVSALGVSAANAPVHPSVCSSIASGNATARTTGVANDLLVPPGYISLGNRYLLAEVTMPYTPIFGSSLVKLVGGTGNITLRTSFAWPERNGFVHNSNSTPPTPELTLPNGSPCP